MRSKFSAVVNRELPVVSFDKTVFGSNLQSFVEVVPVKNSKHVELYFQIPAVEPFYKSKPAGYLAHLLGHESGGSILAALKSKNWATALSAYDYQALHSPIVPAGHASYSSV